MLKNKTTKKVLAKQVISFKTFLQIGIGLMFKTKKYCKNKAFLFHLNEKRKYSITMLFVFFALDIIFLDRNMKVIEIKNNLKPFSHYKPKNKFAYMIEMLHNKKKNVNLGDLLEMQT